MSLAYFAFLAIPATIGAWGVALMYNPAVARMIAASAFIVGLGYALLNGAASW